MNCLIPALSRLPELQTLRSAWQTGALPVAVTGVSAIHKAALAYVLLQSIAAPAGPMLFLAADEAEAQRIVKDLASFGLRTLFYPSRDFNFREMEGASREYEHQTCKPCAVCSTGSATAWFPALTRPASTPCPNKPWTPAECP